MGLPIKQTVSRTQEVKQRDKDAMFKRVEKLKAEHEIIIDAMSQAKSLGITSEEGRVLLLEAKATLLEHLKNEDTYLYPVLKKASQTDDNLKTLISEDVSEIEAVSDMAMKFFVKCEDNQSDAQYLEDFKGLFKALLYRIHNEEKTVYAEYNKIIS